MNILLSFPLRSARHVGFAATLLLGLSRSHSVLADVVINEIHYAPADKTKPTEFIELFNNSSSSADISGWRLANAVTFTIPDHTVVPAHGFAVIAGNPGVFQKVFGFAPLGSWTGRLKHSGATIELRDLAGTLIRSVDYQSGFPWPAAAHGDGASLELINPELDGGLGGSWRSSGTPDRPVHGITYIDRHDPQWRFRKGTSEASTPMDDWRLSTFVEDSSWKTAQTSIGFGDADDLTDLSSNPWNLPTPMQSNYISLYLRHPFFVPDGPLPSRLHLKVTVEDGCILWINGHEVPGRLHMKDNAEKPHDAGVAGRPTGAITHRAVAGGSPVVEDVYISAAAAGLTPGNNLLAIHVFNSTLDGAGVSIDCQVIGETAEPTPGHINGNYSTNAPPQIRQVSHFPAAPVSGDAETITAQVSDPDGVATVTLAYQLVNPGSYLRKSDAAFAGNWSRIPMTDDGLGGDRVAHDGIYTAVLPPSIQIHRRLVRYRILATDSVAQSVQVPYDDDPQPNFAYFVYDGVPAWSGAVRPGDPGPQGIVQNFPATLMGSMPVYHLIANQTDVINSQYNGAFDTIPMWGTLVYDGTVYDHVQFNNRGEFSTYVSGKNKWRIHVNNTHEFQARDNTGHRYQQTWNSFNLNGGSCPWIAANRGMAGMEECVSFRVYELLGVPSPKTHYVSFRIIDQSTEAAPPGATVQDATFPGTGKGQYSGDFWGLYLVTEEPSGAFLDERGLTDGNIYKIHGGGNGQGNKKNQGPTQSTTTADWDAFASGSGRTETESWWRTNLSLPTYYSFRAASRIVGNVDMRNGWNHYFYHHPDGHWMPIPWDLDMMFVGRTHQSASGAITQDNCLQIPRLAIEKRNRARELLDLLLSDTTPTGGQIGQLVDEYAQILNPSGQSQTWADVDAAQWNFHPRTAGSPSAHTDSNHKGNFFYSPHSFTAFGGVYKRWLRAKDFVGFGAFEDYVQYLISYTTDTYPGPAAWVVNNGNQLGYGYEFLKAEAREANASDIPGRPTIRYVGSPDFSINNLRFECSNFAGNQFGAIEWRLGWISAPGLAGFQPGQPRRYEVEAHWSSGESTPFSNHIEPPLNATQPGQTYRARVRHKDTNGRWSRWSEAVQFVGSPPDVALYKDSLVISEIMYHPRPATAAEAALGFLDEDFEYIEVKNTSPYRIDLSHVGFTTGVSFDFGAATFLDPAAFGLVVKNRTAFATRYGPGKPILGEYGASNLKNSGETLTLAYAGNAIIQSLSYQAGSPWPTGAGGTGRSLELISPNSHLDPNLPENWRASLSPLGTPGYADGQTFNSWGASRGSLLDPSGDPDGDGLTNLMEYALGSDPLASSSIPPPGVQIQSMTVNGTSAKYLTLAFRFRTDSADLGYRVEFSHDLTKWSSGAVQISTQQQTDGTALGVWRLPEPVSADDSMFLRLRISL